MVRLGFSMQSKYALPTDEVLALLAKAGFSAVSPVWEPTMDVAALSACVQEHSIVIQSFHAPRGIPCYLWEPDTPDAAAYYDLLTRCLDDCATFHVPTMVMHGWQGFTYTFDKASLDFRLFDQMVDHAEKRGVSIAFENLEGEEFLAALLERYHDRSHVGYCWDSGHDHCYPHTIDFLKRFGDRLIMTHLHDNFGLRNPDGTPSGDDDLHFLPFDGNIDWENAVHRLKACRPQSTLNFEIKLSSFSTDPADRPYIPLPPQEFFARAGEHARKLADMYDRVIG